MFFTPEIVHQIEIQDHTLNIQSFEDLPFADLYCEALIQAGQGNTAEAQRIAQSIKFNLPYSAPLMWKEGNPPTIEDVFNKILASEVRKQPQGLSALGLLESAGLHEHNAFLNNLSLESCLQAFMERKANFALMQNYSTEAMTEEQKVTYAILQWKLAHEIAGEKFLFHEYRISQTFVGILAELIGTFTQHHTISELSNVDHYLMRLAAIPRQLQQTMEVMQHQQKQGIVPPRFAIEKVLNILPHYFETEASAHPLYVYLEEQLSKLELPEKQERLQIARSTIEQVVAPHFRNFHAYCKELLNSAQTDHGVWALPDGEEWYAYLLKAHTTTNLTPDQAHEPGTERSSACGKRDARFARQGRCGG